MCAKSFLMNTNYYEIIKKNNDLISVFNIAAQNGLVELTAQYLLKNSNISPLKLYSKLHELLEINVLTMIEYSVCPYCSNNNIYMDKKLQVCVKCKNMYSTKSVVEKFKLVIYEG